MYGLNSAFFSFLISYNKSYFLCGFIELEIAASIISAIFLTNVKNIHKGFPANQILAFSIVFSFVLANSFIKPTKSSQISYTQSVFSTSFRVLANILTVYWL